MKRKKRYTIGFINSSIHYPWAEYQLSGFLDAAEKQDVNLCVFPGGRLNSPFPGEKQLNYIYEALEFDKLDGIVIWGSGFLDDFSTPDEILKFVKSFQPLPVIMMEQSVPGYPLITMDSYSPLKEVITHLIKVHKVERIGFIRGPVDHVAEKARLKAYLDAMEENHLPVEEHWIVPAYVTGADEEQEIARMGEWFQRCGGELQAIASFNDQRLFFLLDALDRLGMKFPEDLLSCGYDDILRSRYYKPGITTVRAPFTQMARKAVELIVRLLEGKDIPVKTEFTGSVQIRESCGCVNRILPKKLVYESWEELLRFEKRAQKQMLINSISASLPTLPDYRENRKQLIPAFQRFFRELSIHKCCLYLFDHGVSEGEPTPPLRVYFDIESEKRDLRFEKYIEPGDFLAAVMDCFPGRESLVFMPLASKQVQFGIMVLGLEGFDGSAFRSLQVFLSVYFREFRLLEKIKRQSDSLKSTNQTLQISLDELKNTRHLLVLSEKIAALSYLTSGIAQKISAPLSEGLAAAASLRKQFLLIDKNPARKGSGEDLAEIAQNTFIRIERCLNQAADLINQFKTVSTSRKAEQERTFSLYGFFQETAEYCLARWKDKVDIGFSCPQDLFLTSLPGTLSQVVIRLVDNSVIHAGNRTAKCRIFLKAETVGKGVSLMIDDNGPGIPAHVIDRIFDPFFTTREGENSSGLGLYIVYNLVAQSLKGNIKCVNLPGQGVRFTITIPD